MLFVSYLLALAVALVVRDEAKPLSFSLNKKATKEAVTSDRSFRSAPGTQRVELWVDGFTYDVDIDIGNKGQTITVELDTGSADLWVDRLVLKDVSTWRNLSEPYSVWYYDGTLIDGWYGKSLIWLDNGLEVKDFQYALATELRNTGNQHGIFGIGRVENESVDKDKRYPNFVQHLKDLGHIKTNGYLYYLNAKDATHGSIVFGGIDKAKIKGKVATVPLTTESRNSRFDNIIITKITGVDGEVIGENIEAAMDTGYTLSRLPASVVKQVQKHVPDSYERNGIIYVPCELDPSLYILVWFNDVEIKYTLNDLSIRSVTESGKFTGKCALGIQSTLEGNPNFFGVSSLKHAYVTVNHDDNVAYISNVNYTDEEDIVLL